MIVQEPPYDLVVLFADLEMQKLFEELIERGQDEHRRCVRPIRWRSLRDPRRDPVWREPNRGLAPFVRTKARFLIIWDHHGSGLEHVSAGEVQERAVKKLTACGVAADRVLAVALEPEVETLFVPVWPRVKEIISAERARRPPGDDVVFATARRKHAKRRLPDHPDLALQEYPKEMFEGLVRWAQLRRAAPLYQKIGTEISLPGIKQSSPASRIVETLRSWFPWTPGDQQ